MFIDATLGGGCDVGRRRSVVPLLCAGMPSRRDLLTRPRDYLLSIGKWPHGPFKANPPYELLFFVELSKRLNDLCYDEEHPTTITAIAKDANLSVQTVFNVLEGRTWSDLPTIYRLEVALNAPLWQNPDIDWP